MSAQEPALDTCGCCEGIEALTPQSEENRPGLTSLAYRSGDHAAFKQTMLAALSGPGGPQQLTARGDDDPSVALLDAAATMLDVLTFYQERIANEGYLRTATERLSVLELAREIGYELGPGVAAGTLLAFELETAPGAPLEADIHTGMRVQSLPGQNEKPQTYETVEAVEARAEWNRLRPRTSRPQVPAFGETTLYVQGATTNLKPGDAVLLVGDERIADPGNENWDLRRVAAVRAVTPAAGAAYTVVIVDRGLGTADPFTLPAATNPRLYALRQRAALFGHNAPDWRSMPAEIKRSYLGLGERDPIPATQTEWPGFTIADISGPESAGLGQVHLDAVYSSVTAGGWAVLFTPDYAELYRIEQAVEDGRTNFTLSSKMTALTLRGEQLQARFNSRLRDTAVFAQSEELLLAAEPVTEPLEGDVITLDKLYVGLEVGRTLVVSGKCVRLSSSSSLVLTAADGIQTTTLPAGESARLLAAPVPLDASTLSAGELFTWQLEDKHGFVGTVQAAAAVFTVEPALADDPLESEAAQIKAVTPQSDPTEIVLEKALAGRYDVTTAVLYANVARATHGETRREVLGGGNAATPFQRFTLKQKPLTYVSAATASGSTTTLEVRVDDVLWHETPSLYGRGPRDRVYITRRADDGTVTVQFGDGRTGARLPTGVENVRAVYRSGTGVEGLVKAGQLSLLMTRPLGVQKAHNPLAPTGAADPESLDRARENAPFTVLTLGRIVSQQDFEDFARSFGGIGKAQATLLWDGEKRTVHVTVAAVAPAVGTADYRVDAESDLYTNLLLAMDAARDDQQPMEVASYEPLLFRLTAHLRLNPDYLAESVLPAARAALLDAFAFERRSFGQPAHKSEVMARLQAVAGVEAVFLDQLYLRGAAEGLADVLPARRAVRQGSITLPAQLLLIDPAGIDLREVAL